MKCSFCGEEMEEGKGKMFVTAKGERYYYCSKKCEKNHRKLGRKPRDTKWTKKGK